MANDLPAHHLLGPSTAKRWTNCYGCISMYEKAPKPIVNRYATEGTLAHYIAAAILRYKIWGEITCELIADTVEVGTKFWVSADDQSLVSAADPTSDPTGEMEEREWHDFKVTQEMLDAINVYVNYCMSITADVGKHNVFVEERLSIPSRIGNINPILALGGTVDFGAVKVFDRIIVADYKHGAGVPVSPYENEQALSYALALFLKLDEFDRQHISTIEIVIVQPRGLGNGISVWECTPDDLLIWQGKMLYAQKQIHEGNTSLVAGSWCKWCPAGGVCSVRESSLSEAVGTEILATDFEEPKLLVSTFKNISVERLVKIVEVEKPLKAFIESAKELLENLTRKGKKTGYEIAMSTKNVRRTWIDGDEPVDLLAEMGVDMYKKTLKTPKQVEDELKTLGKSFDLKFFTEQKPKEVFQKIQEKGDVIDADFDIIE